MQRRGDCIVFRVSRDLSQAQVLAAELASAQLTGDCINSRRLGVGLRRAEQIAHPSAARATSKLGSVIDGWAGF